jgi:elongation factor 1-gamma
VRLSVEDKDNAPESILGHALGGLRTFDSRWPVLLTPSGPLWNSTSIARFVARSGDTESNLLGYSYFEQGLVDQWVDFTTSELQLAINAWIYPILGYLQTSNEEKDIAKRVNLDLLKRLNSYLLHNTYLAGERITLADITVFTAVLDLFIHVLDANLLKSISNVTRWFLTCFNHPIIHPFVSSSNLSASAYLNSLGKGDYTLPNQESAAEEEGGEDESGSQISHSESHKAVTKSLAHDADKHVHVPRPTKKLTEKDLENKAIASVYHPHSPTKDHKKGKHQNSPGSLKNIHQPK